jgi:hypothetical protein
MENEEPRREKLRSDTVEPSCKKSRTEIDEPKRAKLLSEIADPRFVYSRTDKDEANREIPNTEKDEPMRP